jgi:hypothetical protein
MALVIAVPAGRNDVLIRVATTVGTGVQMLGGAAERPWRPLRVVVSLRRRGFSGIVPHLQAAVVAAATLGHHLPSADTFQ